jgi:hypothetical protein
MQSIEKVMTKALVAATLVLTSALPGFTDEVSANYKLAEPKLDTSRPAEEPKVVKPKGPLTGNIQRTEKHHSNNPLKGRNIFGGGYGHAKQGLSGRADDSLNRPLTSQVQSSIGIIGVKFVATTGHAPVINQVFPGTPAEQKGLRVYDRIVAVDGVPTTGLTKDEVFDLIVGSPGTQVTLSIMRGSDFQAVNCVRMDINELTDPRIRRDYMVNM